MAWEAIKESEMSQPSDQKQLTHGFCEKCFNTNNELIKDETGKVLGSRYCNH